VGAQQVGLPSLDATKDREQVAMLIGDFTAIESVFQAGVSGSEDVQLFRGVVDTQRGIGLVNQISRPLELSTTPQYELRYFEVCRDYGMFDRAEAPQQFA
jgi:hypothetical protein